MNKLFLSAPLTTPPWSELRIAAWTSLSCHLIAGLAMAVVLGRGLETEPNLIARLTFVGRHSAVWTAGWAAWCLAALSVLYFYTCFFRAHSEAAAHSGSTGRGTALTYALVLGAAAVPCDLAAQALEFGLLPALARSALAAGAAGNDAAAVGNAAGTFLLVHRAAVMLTGCVANALYTLAAALFVHTTRGAYPAWVRNSGYAVAVAGLALSAAAVANSAAGMFWSNVILVPAILAWQAGIAICAGRRGLGS